MTSLTDDLSSVLSCYVKRKSQGEIEFDKKQEESGVKVCEHIIHEHSRRDDGKDKLRLITQISHVSDNCETPIPTIEAVPPLNEKQNSSDLSAEPTPQISDYYLKCLSLSHVKSKSLDNDHDAKLDGYHRTKITAVVGDTSCKYERVHNTTLVHSANGHKVEKEYSFTRHVASSNSSSNSRPSSYYSLPSQIHNSSLIDRVNGTSKKKSGKKFKWKRFFSTSKSSHKKTEVNLKEIDSLAMREVHTMQMPPTTAPVLGTIETDSVDGKWARQDSRKSTNLVFNITQQLPFRSHPIGGKSLQPLYKDKKTKKVPNFFSSIMTTESFGQKAHTKKGKTKTNKKYTIDMDKGLDDKVKKVVADVSRCGDTEDFSYQINPDDLDYADGVDDDNPVFFMHERSNRQRSMSSNISISHVDMMRLSVKERRPSCPPTTVVCACRDRRIDVMVEFLRLVIKKNKNEKKLAKLKAEIGQFNQELWHFVDCPMIQCLEASDVSRSVDSWRQSQASLYSTNSCALCIGNIDDHLNENFSPTLLPFLEKMESEEEINCPVETIEYFLRATCYKHFEKGLLKIIGTQCTMKNVALLHYLTRRIVKHIGDPADTDNKKIKTILKYCEKFYMENYYPHIKNIHKSMESFLISSNDNDDVD